MCVEKNLIALLFVHDVVFIVLNFSFVKDW